MSENIITIRLETKDDYRAVENLTREAFWNGFPAPVGLGRRKCKAYILTVQSGNIAALEK